MTTLNSKMPTRYRPEIDGLRAFAIAVVLLNHFHKDLLPGGYLGVDIFFVISGYVITSSLEHSTARNLPSFLISFYERRVKRLLPALYSYVLFSSLLITILSPVPGYSLKTALFSLFGFSNVFLYSQSTNYFGSDAELNPFNQTWSLGVEEQFYLVYPLLFWFFRFPTRSFHIRKYFIALILTLAITSIVLFVARSNANIPAAFYLVTSRFWEIAAGSVAYLVKDKIPAFPRFTSESLSTLIIFVLISLTILTPGFSPISIILCVLTTAALLLVLIKDSLVKTILSLKIVVYFGKISYSLYLWHWGVLSFSNFIPNPFGDSWLLKLFFTLLSSTLSYHVIENNLRRAPWFDRGYFNILLSLICAFFIGLNIVLLSTVFKGRLFSSKYHIDDFTYVQKRLNCELGSRLPYSVPDCLGNINKSRGSRNIYMFGNSHSSNLFPSVVRANSSLRHNAYDRVYYYTNATLPNAAVAWNKDPYIIKLLLGTNSKDLIIYSRSCCSSPKDVELVANEIRFILSSTLKSQAKILLVDDLPWYGGDFKFFTSFGLWQDGPKPVPKSEARRYRSFYTKHIKELALSSPRVFYFDPMITVCPGDSCSVILNDSLIYADGSAHFNHNGQFLLANPLSDELMKIALFK